MAEKISAVVPVYNSQESIELLVSRLSSVLGQCSSEHEIILVNDGSSDNSWEQIEKAATRNESVVGVNLMRNFGQHNALLCGIRLATGNTIVTIDDDLQDPPEEIPKLLSELERGKDVVYGARAEESYGFCRDLGSKITRLALQSTMGINIARKVSAFRAFRTELREAFKDYDGSFLSLDVLLTWATTKFSAVETEHVARQFGRSNYSLRMLVVHALNMITGFSILPLQVATLVGLAAITLGFALLLFVIGNYIFYGAPVPGFAFLASAISLFSGVQLFSLGIIGEYLARVHLRTMKKPTYAVRGIVAGRPK